jgi:hypothetical protein
MSDCNRLSDRMPQVALGQAEWTMDEVRHLSACRSCQAEWNLVQLGSRLGEAGLPALDPVATTRTVLQRLEHARVGRFKRRAWSFAGLAAAATLAAVIWTDRLADRSAAPAPVVAGVLIPLPELEGLQPAELDSVLQTMDEPLLDGSTLEAPSLGDLDTTELQSFLDYWEG